MCRVVWERGTNTLEDHTVCNFTLLPWWWKEQVLPKCSYLSAGVYSVTSEKNVILTLTTVRTANCTTTHLLRSEWYSYSCSCRAHMFERRCCWQAQRGLQLLHKLPPIQSITQIDKPRRAIYNWKYFTKHKTVFSGVTVWSLVRRNQCCTVLETEDTDTGKG